MELEKIYNSAYIDGHLAQYKKDIEIHGPVFWVVEMQNAAIFYKIMANIQKSFIENAISELTDIYNTYMPQPQESATVTFNPTQKEEKPFADYLHHENKDALMKKLHELLDNAKGKNVAFVIKSLEELKYLAGYNSRNELYASMKNEFGNFGSNQSVNDFLNPNNSKIHHSDIAPYLEILKNI